MEIVNFSDKTWQEIPEQDNPAMIYSTYKSQHRSVGVRGEECIMIFKGRFDRITDGGIVVAHVPLEGDITKKGVFWRLELAEKFARFLARALDK